jgi:hypothetical protein
MQLLSEACISGRATRMRLGKCNLIRMAKTESLPRLKAAQVPNWLLQTSQQIQVLDYELHAAMRILRRGEMNRDDIAAFKDVCEKRDRLMARIIRHLSSEPEQGPGSDFTGGERQALSHSTPAD